MEGFTIHAPAGPGIDYSGQRVDDGVHIRTDRQPQMLEVIPRIDDDAQLRWGQEIGQTLNQLGPSHTPRQCDDAQVSPG